MDQKLDTSQQEDAMLYLSEARFHHIHYRVQWARTSYVGLIFLLRLTLPTTMEFFLQPQKPNLREILLNLFPKTNEIILAICRKDCFVKFEENWSQLRLLKRGHKYVYVTFRTTTQKKFLEPGYVLFSWSRVLNHTVMVIWPSNSLFQTRTICFLSAKNLIRRKELRLES